MLNYKILNQKNYMIKCNSISKLTYKFGVILFLTFYNYHLFIQ